MYNETYLQHYGILGQKWGIRRWQNKDGTYNAAGKNRYGGHLSKSGKYVASNGVVIARSRSKSAAAMRKFGTTIPGRLLSAAGRKTHAKATGRSIESLKEQEKKRTRSS